MKVIQSPSFARLVNPTDIGEETIFVKSLGRMFTWSGTPAADNGTTVLNKSAANAAGWRVVTEAVGATGPTGATGPAGPTGPIGPTGP